ncbi:ABC transporter substrate-binding protein [Nonomuraea sp. NBC_00507]|uniref:ABC transporter substrate-binding protein n=1 Tax=Nonomuraea sp. NBC_00507 TaxID=2976002 RepID=UPI002E16D71C
MQRTPMAWLAVVAGLVTTLAACGSSASSGTDTASNAGASATTTEAGAKKVKVTFIEGVAGDPFYETMACGAKEAAAQHNVDLNVQGAKNWDVSLQIPMVNSVIAARPDALFIAPNDSQALIQPLKQATEAGIKVVLVDTTLSDTSFVASAIASDNVKGGQVAADALAKLIGEKGSVLLVGGQPGVSTAEARQKGFEEGLKKYPNIKYLGNVFTSNGVAKISQLVSAQLAAHPDLAGIFALSTDQSQGANNAVKAAGKAGTIKLVGFDAGPAQVEQLRDDVVQALVAQQPAQIGADGVAQAAAAARGEQVQKQIGTDSTVITKENVDDPEVAKYLYTTTCN